MISLAKGFGRSASTGRPLPEVYKSFTAPKIVFRRSATSMIAGAPGAFKSALALNLLTRWAGQGITGLYFSADADQFTTAKRTAAILTHRTVDTVEHGMRNGGARQYREALRAMDSTRWVYEATDISEIDRHMRGFEDQYGDFPSVIFIDNLLNMASQGDGDWAGCRDFIRDLDILAREAETHVCVLHHTSEAAFNAGFPPPRSSIMGKISQFPRLILTVGVNGAALSVACVKNTNGPQDPTGNTFLSLNIDAERMTITDPVVLTQGVMQSEFQ